LKKLLLILLKVSLSLGILAYLVAQAHGNRVFADLAQRYKDPGLSWGLLVLATAACFLAVLISLIRWYFLVRAVDVPFRLRDALRLGFLGYLFNLMPMGIVGGDLLKAVMLAKENRGRRPEAVASVFVDRVIGLYVLFVVASAAILLTGFLEIPHPRLQWVAKLTLALTALATVAVALPLLPDLSRGKTTRWIAGVPYVGLPLFRLLEAVRMYRLKLPILAVSTLMTVAIHSFFAVGIYLIARGIYGEAVPSLGMHFVIAPLSAVTGVIPLPLGPFEMVLDLLYAKVPLPFGGSMAVGQGLVVALAYRIISVLCAAVGICYYLGSRQEVSDVMHHVDLAENDNEAAAV
jgi:glycosyltransferase 2 family protein